MKFAIATTLSVLMLSAGPVCAQDSGKPADPPVQPAIDATKLGIDFNRVKMELAQPPAPPGAHLKIHETVEVVGIAPKIQLWDPKTVKAELTSQAVPYGAPTQKDILKLIVPKEFQTQPMDINALVQWLMEHLNKKSE